MFRAAFQSACAWKPQSGFLHTNVAWSSRLPGVVRPQAEQRREVPGAGTLTRAPPRWASWSGSYFAGSCGGAPLAVVKQYIEQRQRPVS